MLLTSEKTNQLFHDLCRATLIVNVWVIKKGFSIFSDVNGFTFI
jgi:hypothetical protein